VTGDTTPIAIRARLIRDASLIRTEAQTRAHTKHASISIDLGHCNEKVAPLLEPQVQKRQGEEESG